MTSLPARRPGRPRNNQTRQAILQTAFRLAQERGYRHVSITEIAAQANVGRQTIYRWWPTKNDLYLEVIAEIVAESSNSNTNNRPDLLAHLRSTFQLTREKTGALGLELLLEAQQNPKLQSDMREIVGMRREKLKQAVDDLAHAQGKQFIVPTDVVVDMLAGILWYRLLQENAPLDDALAKMLVQTVDALLR